jgi:hypothetical protein
MFKSWMYVGFITSYFQLLVLFFKYVEVTKFPWHFACWTIFYVICLLIWVILPNKKPK